MPCNKSQGLHREFNIVSGVVLKHIFQKQTEAQAGYAFVRKTLTIKVNLRQVGDIICFCIILPPSSFSNSNIGRHELLLCKFSVFKGCLTTNLTAAGKHVQTIDAYSSL